MSGDILWTAEDVLRAVRGRCLHEQSWHAADVSIDSRTVRPGDLFVALQGPAHDGHDHVAAAFAGGAVAALVSRQPAKVGRDQPLILVEDTLRALQDLGRTGRARTKARIVAVTGSVGKTSSKEMLRLALGAVGATFANPGSFNNHWGLPLSLARMPPGASFGVFELGMNHAGELTQLTALARPDIALITGVEAAHLEFFASVEAIADAKAEIFQGVPATGFAVLNRDNAHHARLAAAARACGIKNILSFGRDGKADARLIDSAVTAEGCVVNARIDGESVHYAIGSPGAHLVQNSLGVLLAAHCAAPGRIQDMAAALQHYRQPKGRGTIARHPLPGGAFTLIDESYNASPAAVRAAIAVLGQMRPDEGGRRILALGDMRELGATSPQLHAGLAEPLREAGIDLVFCCGEQARHLYDAVPEGMRGAWAPDSAALAPQLAAAIRANDIVTVKGSLSMGMARVVAALTAPTARPQTVETAN